MVFTGVRLRTLEGDLKTLACVEGYDHGGADGTGAIFLLGVIQKGKLLRITKTTLRISITVRRCPLRLQCVNGRVKHTLQPEDPDKAKRR